MADELDHLQVQEDLLTRLHIQAARQQLIRDGESLSECECCGNDIPLRRQQTIPGVRTCTECQRVLEIRNKHYQRGTMENRTGNVMVAGKTAISVEVMQTLLSARQRNDWLELRQGMQKNGKNAGDEHHDK